MASRRFLLALLATLQSLSAFAQSPSVKLPIPDSAARKKSAAVIKDLYGEKFKQAKTAEAKIATAKSLFKLGVDSSSNPTSRYVMFRISKDIAAGAGDADIAFVIIEQMDKFYQVNGMELKNPK